MIELIQFIIEFAMIEKALPINVKILVNNSGVAFFK
jgi:hypothetical protein